MRIKEEYRKSGFFWIPGKASRKIPGTLIIVDGGRISLEVVGLFDTSLEALNADEEYIRIVGHVEGDGYVTLEKCFYLNKSISFGEGISKSLIRANQAFIGVAYDEGEPKVFNYFSFSFDCLDEWVGITGIRVDRRLQQKTATITYVPQKEIGFSASDGAKISIGFGYTLPGAPCNVEAKITHNTFMSVSTQTQQPLDYFIDLLHKLSSFLCFAMDETVSVKNLVAKSPDVAMSFPDGSSREHPVKIYFRSINFVDKEPAKSRHKMLFDYSFLAGDLELFLKNWFDAYEVISPSLNLYFATKFNAYKYLDGTFLALVQGLETYHRRTSSERIMDDEKFDSLVATLLETCPEPNREWLKARLSYGNEISLAKRITRVIEPYASLFGEARERKRLVRKIVDTRNYFTHYNETLKGQAASGEELWDICQKVEAIFQLHLLKVIGFDSGRISVVVNHAETLKHKL